MEPKHSHHDIRLRIRADHTVYLAVHDGSLRYALKPVSGTHQARIDKAEFLLLLPSVDFRAGDQAKNV